MLVVQATPFTERKAEGSGHAATRVFPLCQIPFGLKHWSVYTWSSWHHVCWVLPKKYLSPLRNLMWPIKSVLFVDCVRCHGVQLCRNVLTKAQLLITVFNSCIPQRQLGGFSMTRPFLSAKGAACETRYMYVAAFTCLFCSLCFAM